MRSHVQSGAASAELVLATPVILLLLLFVVLVGRLTESRTQLNGAAHAAARAASISRTPQGAISAARSAAAANLADQHVTCRNLQVSVDTSQFHPGGWVSVNVQCSVDLSDLAGLRVPATQTVAARSVEVIDRFEGSG